jgi:hypothetical protein
MFTKTFTVSVWRFAAFNLSDNPVKWLMCAGFRFALSVKSREKMMGFSGSVMPLDYDFHLDISHFKEALRQHWPDTTFKDLADGDIDFGMTIAEQFDDFVGSTIEQRQVGWWGTLESQAEFAVWFRKYVPREIALLTSSKNFCSQVVVSKDTTEEDIVSALSGDKYYFQVHFRSESELRLIVPDALRNEWDSILLDCENNSLECNWWLRSQDGHTNSGEAIIYFDDTNLYFAAEFPVWCRKHTNEDLMLVAEDVYATVTRLPLTAETSTEAIFEHLITAFRKA